MLLLNELLDLSYTTNQQLLVEDLGKLRELGLGTMVNAFKQSFNYDSRGRSNENRFKTSEIGKKIRTRETGIGPNSESKEMGIFKNFNNLRRVIKSNDLVAAVVIKIDHKPMMLLVLDNYNRFNSVKDAFGMAWDFTKLSGDDLNAVKTFVSKVEIVPTQYNDTRVDHYAEKENSKTKISSKERDWDKKENVYITKTREYIAHAQSVGNTKDFFNEMGAYFGNRMTFMVVLRDDISAQKRIDRRNNVSPDKEKLKYDLSGNLVSKTDVELQDEAKEALKKRLAIFKNSKLESTNDVKEFLDKALKGKGSKLNFAGITYSLTPNSYNKENLIDVVKGKKFDLFFGSSDPKAQYETLTITMQLKDGTMVPIKAVYTDKTGFGGVRVEKDVD